MCAQVCYTIVLCYYETWSAKTLMKAESSKMDLNKLSYVPNFLEDKSFYFIIYFNFFLHSLAGGATYTQEQFIYDFWLINIGSHILYFPANNLLPFSVCFATDNVCDHIFGQPMSSKCDVFVDENLMWKQRYIGLGKSFSIASHLSTKSSTYTPVWLNY